MNKAELIDNVTERLGIDKRTANNAVEAVIDTITRTVAKGEKVALTGFGVFERVERGPRTARNPKTGAAVKVKKTASPKFRPGTQFKEVVSGARKLAKVADAATKAAARSVGTSATKTARTAAATPSKAATAANRAATKAAGSRPASARPAAGRPTKAAAAKAAPAKKAAAAKAPAKKAAPTRAPAKAAKAPAKKAPAKKAPAKATRSR